METEKRKHCRFTTTDDVFASLGHQFITVGKIKDISQGGLSFTYWSNEELLPKTPHSLDIFHRFSGLHMSNLPCKVVYNMPENIQDMSRPITLPILAKQCGVQFDELTQDQSVQLTSFIEKIISDTGHDSA